MYQYVTGILTVVSIIPAVFFWSSWRRSGDRFFLFFALAFAILTVERAVMGIKDLPEAPNIMLYTIRLVGFLLIIAAIVDKNRSRTS